MSLSDFLNQPDWDQPFFKRLPSNDTGAAPGHQGGMVIPKDLRRFFPGLVGPTSSVTPTIERRIWAELFDGKEFLDRVNTRYQYQTWGGARPPESRLTDNLSALRNKAAAEDILVIQRSLIELDLYRLILIRRSGPLFDDVDKIAGNKRWGILGVEPPMTEIDYEKAVKQELQVESQPFSLFDSKAKVTTSTASKVARSVAFKARVIEVYEGACCICRTGLRAPEGPVEVEAAHIVPRRLFGTDDARNGLSLCRRHHWAFDRGLLGIDNTRRVYVPAKVLAIAQNKPLIEVRGTAIKEASLHSVRAATEALGWHMKHVVLQ
jgi:putative restriction endonuclease